MGKEKRNLHAKVRRNDDGSWSIGLGNGGYADVDKEDYEWLSQYRWYRTQNGYAQGVVGGRHVYMHRLILSTEEGMDTDHINQNKLDNRRGNLRPLSRSFNNHNQGPRRNNTSGHTGVNWFKPAKLWRAYIKVESVSPKRIELGYFKTKEEAIKARKYAENKLLGNIR